NALHPEHLRRRPKPRQSGGAKHRIDRSRQPLQIQAGGRPPPRDHCRRPPSPTTPERRHRAATPDRKRRPPSSAECLPSPPPISRASSPTRSPPHKLHRRTKRGPLLYVLYPRQRSVDPPREQLCLSLTALPSLLPCSNHENLTALLKCGVYLVLDKLELQVYRRLVKKIHIIQREKEPSKANQIKLEVSATILVE
uniref:Uncharacterized protein n=1 Tax=Aegilops tauschii subsp. strangulata TaxID=200361 RepID=A0A453GIU6_AEGTS